MAFSLPYKALHHAAFNLKCAPVLNVLDHSGSKQGDILVHSCLAQGAVRGGALVAVGADQVTLGAVVDGATYRHLHTGCVNNVQIQIIVE